MAFSSSESSFPKVLGDPSVSHEDFRQGDDNSMRLKDTLVDLISEVKSAGSFATYGTISDFINPGLALNPIGPLRLPLSESDARSLILESRKAAFGKGKKTLRDKSARKTWEIDAKKFKFQNEEWVSYLDRIVSIVADELGIVGGPQAIRAEPYKMLLFEEGATFQEQKGYSDVLHEFDTRNEHTQMEPVKSGYRWVATYCLINVSRGPSQSATVQQIQSEAFTRSLCELQKGCDDKQRSFVFALDHQYTQERLQWARLRGKDYHRAHFMARHCAEPRKFFVFLANVEFWVETYVSGGNGDDYNPFASSHALPLDHSLHLMHLTDFEGNNLLPNSRKISRSALLQKTYYKERKRDSWFGGEYTEEGEYETIKHTYKDSVVILVHAESVIKFLVETGDQNVDNLCEKTESVQSLIERLTTLSQSGNNKTSQEILSRMLQSAHMFLPNDKALVRDTLLGSCAVAAAQLREALFFSSFVEKTSTSFDEKTFAGLGRVITFRDLGVSKDDIVKALKKVPVLRSIYDNLSSFRRGYLDENPESKDPTQKIHTDQWLHNILFQTLNELTGANQADAVTIASIIRGRSKYSFVQLVMYQGVLNFVDRFSADLRFMHALMVELLEEQSSLTGPKDYVRSLLRRISKTVLSNFDLGIFVEYAGKRARKHEVTLGYDGLYEGLIRRYYHYSRSYDTNNTSILLERIWMSVDEKLMKESVIPILNDLLSVVDISSREVRKYYELLVKAYITTFAPKLSEKPTDWARPEEKIVVCDDACERCSDLNKFLSDPKAERHEMSLACADHVEGSQPLGNLRYLAMVWPTRGSTDVHAWKTLKRWEEQNENRQIAATAALEALRGFSDAERLKKCLGPDYDDLMNFRNIDRFEEEVRLMRVEGQSANEEEIDATCVSLPRKRQLDDTPARRVQKVRRR
ncbi:MAG: hypothetical protein M1814_003365 [Vezdaea aestivalis]|nr:MAG: hypothetical protein M1814_003365 [Vezdaea aestivalis]